MKAKINWSQVVTFILDNLFFSQKELAEHCNVTQQSISNWKMKVRTPGPYAKRKLTEIASNAGASMTSFKMGYKPQDQTSPDVVLQELINLYNELPLKEKEFVLEFTRFIKRKSI
jgi:transcriptional regulator with XRE-family HTH domain